MSECKEIYVMIAEILLSSTSVETLFNASPLNAATHARLHVATPHSASIKNTP